MYGSLFPRDVLAELSRLQSEVQRAFDISPSIRGLGRGGFPAVNVGATPETLELYVFAPGLDPATVEVNLDRGALSIAGSRKTELPAPEQKASVHINERFQGKFRRVVSLPDDADPNGVSATYRDGILHIQVKRREQSQPRRITIQ
ncbi:MAG: Hsp20/alpha crystallin family protein [Burkholderiales bacterium]|nr:Hsp20/alpha crystallin family protein [Burkholderiales bacterium]